MPALLEPELSATSTDGLLRCAADYPAEPVRWLWPGRLPIGKVTLLVGDPGTGKSLVALDIASRVSRGAPWPDEEESRANTAGPPLSTLGSRLPGSVVILSAEDDLSDTIRPRLDAAGADPSRIFMLPAITDLRHDLDKLRGALERLPDCRLIVIDPVNSYVGPGDSHFHTIVRRVFQPLAELAAEKGLAVLAISHLRKHDGAAIQRAAGSMGFVAAARSVWTVSRDPVQLGRQLLLPLKNNFVAETDGLAYQIAAGGEDALSAAPAIAWYDETVSASAVEVLASEKKARGPDPAELKLAMDWLNQELVHGPKGALFVYGDGVICGGFTERTLRRALAAIGGRTRKLGFGVGWEWYLPDYDFPSQPERLIDRTGPAPPPLSRTRTTAAPSDNLSPSAETCPLREKTRVSAPGMGPRGAEPPAATVEPAMVLPEPFGQPALIGTHSSIPPAKTRKLQPEEACASLTPTHGPDRIVTYEQHLAQCKLRRILKSRWRLGGRRPKLKRVGPDLLKPDVFRHPACSWPP